jgi:hypothetical protein
MLPIVITAPATKDNQNPVPRLLVAPRWAPTLKIKAAVIT